jgi:hypothetical protein
MTHWTTRAIHGSHRDAQGLGGGRRGSDGYGNVPVNRDYPHYPPPTISIPGPVQAGGVPIVVGRSVPKAARRAVASAPGPASVRVWGLCHGDGATRGAIAAGGC